MIERSIPSGLRAGLLDHGAIDVQRPHGPAGPDSACEGHGGRAYFSVFYFPEKLFCIGFSSLTMFQNIELACFCMALLILISYSNFLH